MDDDSYELMLKLFRIACYNAVREKPFADFPGLLELQDLNGTKLGDVYRTDKKAKEFIEHIAGVYHDNLQELLHSSDYFSAYCDGSTDRSNSEKEIVMVRVLVDYYPRIKFLKLVEPPNTKGTGIFQAIGNAFEDFGFTESKYTKKMIGFGSDGANVMMGERQGVITLLKEEGHALWVLSVWCLTHRLELAVKDCFKDTYMDVVTEVLTLVYYFYKGAAKRHREVQEIADVMEDHFLKPEKANGTRLVQNKLQATAKLVNNWKYIVMHLQNYAEDRSNKSTDREKAKGILWFMHFLKDVLNEVAKVSLIFKRDVHVPAAVAKIQSAKLSLQKQERKARS